VHLTEFVPAPKEKDTIKEPAPAKEKSAPIPDTTTDTIVREDTVNMGSQDSRYRSYLLKIKKRIEDKWQYPEAALRKKEKGATTIKFSINNDGALYAQEILSSSSSQILDEYTLTVIRAGAPYDRLPTEMGLSRLHIVAVFHYRLTE
jgi:protein TonB